MINGKLASILRMLDSPNEGEAANAFAAARRFMVREGITFGDITRAAEAHAHQGVTATARPSDAHRGYSTWAEEARRAADDILRREAEQRRRGEAEERRRRAEEELREAQEHARYEQERELQLRRIIRKYGSAKRAMAPTHREAAVDAAAQFISMDHGETLGGWTGADEPIPPGVAVAVRSALPWPSSLEEAAREEEFWTERDRELGWLLRKEEAESSLSLACLARHYLIGDALAFDMRAASIADLSYRLRYAEQQGIQDTRFIEAMQRDVENLARSGVQFGQANMRQSRASDRRAAVIEMLRDPDLACLPDRELARRAGVSPSTIGNLRRKAAQAEFAL